MRNPISIRSLALVLGSALALGAAFALAAPPDHATQGKPPWNKKNNLEVANLNILHGHACDPPVPGDGDQCRVRDRMDLLIQEIVAAGCPDVVTLQENVTSEFVQTSATATVGPLDDTTALIEDRLPQLDTECGFPYEMVIDPDAARPPAQGRGIDEELILTRYPALAVETLPLYSPLVPFFFRHVLYARIDHPRGSIDVFTTHLASGSDLANLPCGFNALPPPFVSPPCPAECAGGLTVRRCQARQMADFVEARHNLPEPAILSGDFNARPGSNEYLEFTGRGWVDSHLAVGNPECAPATGIGCTSGRDDNDLSDLESPVLNVGARIDFIFVVPAEPGSECSGVIQRFDHPVRPATTTGIFAGEPNEPCGAAPLPTCFVSDHSGNQLNLRCQP